MLNHNYTLHDIHDCALPFWLKTNGKGALHPSSLKVVAMRRCPQAKVREKARTALHGSAACYISVNLIKKKGG